MSENKSTQIATSHQSVGLTPVGAQGTQWTPEQVELIKTQVLKGGSDDELQVFLYQCARTGLDPFTRQIYGIKRWDDDAKKMTVGVQLSIDGLRLVAERTGRYKGQTACEWCGTDGVWKDVWLSNDPPAAARVGVLKAGFDAPLFRIARFSAYAGKKKDGGLTRMWATMGDVMIAKCAEALALRTAFPQELSGLYAGEEMDQAGEDQQAYPRSSQTQKNEIKKESDKEEKAPVKKEKSAKKDEPQKTTQELRSEAPSPEDIEKFRTAAQAAKTLLTNSEKTGMNNEFRAGYTATGIRLAIDFLNEVIEKRPVPQPAADVDGEAA